MEIKMENKAYVTLYENLCRFSEKYIHNNDTHYPTLQQDMSQLIGSLSNVRHVIGVLNSIDEKNDSKFSGVLDEIFLYLTQVEDGLSYTFCELTKIVDEI